MKCQVLVDWLTFSVKEKDPAIVIQEYLGMEPELFQDAGYGLLGYNRVLRFSDICVCHEPRENQHFKNMGVCVSMSGKQIMDLYAMGVPIIDTRRIFAPKLWKLFNSYSRKELPQKDWPVW